MTVLSTVQESIERTFYKALRAVTEEHGYIPDITLFANNQVGQNNYNAAVQAIVALKGFAIEVFGHSNSQAKNTKLAPRIVVKPRRIIEGEIGLNSGKTFTLNSGDASFKSFIVPGTSSHIHLDIYLVSNTAAQHRILHAIMMAALNFRGYLETYDNTGQFFYRFIGYEDEENTLEGQMDNIYSYEVVDIDMTQQVEVSGEVAKIVEITNEIYEGTYFPTPGFNSGDYELTDTQIIT